MEHITLGRTGLQVSRAGLGCGGHSRLGQGYGASQDHSVGVVKAALDLGINFIDTAQVYGTEGIVGEAVQGRRDQVVLSSKAQIVQPGTSGLGSDFIEGNTVKIKVEKSLKSLKSDYIDIYHLHGILPHQYDICVDQFLPVLNKLRDEGKIRYIGITERFIHDPSHQMLGQALVDNHWDVVMVGFNMINPSARKTIFPLTKKNNVGVLDMFAVRNALSTTENMQALIHQLKTEGHLAASDVDEQALTTKLLEETLSGNLTEAAYRFCCHEPDNQVVLTGTGKIEHLKENVKAVSQEKLSQDIREELLRVFGHINGVSGE